MKKLGGYIRPATAAQYLGMTLSEIQEMLESGELPGVKFGGQWRVPLAELEKWLDEDVSENEIRKLASHLDVDPKAVDEYVNEKTEDKELN